MTTDTEKPPACIQVRRAGTFTLKEIADLVGVPQRIAFLMGISGMTKQEEVQKIFVALASLTQQMNTAQDVAGVRLRLIRLEARATSVSHPAEE